MNEDKYSLEPVQIIPCVCIYKKTNTKRSGTLFRQMVFQTGGHYMAIN